MIKMAADPLEEKINKIRQQNEEIRRRYEVILSFIKLTFYIIIFISQKT